MNLKCDACQKKINKTRTFIPKGTSKPKSLCLDCWNKEFDEDRTATFSVIGNKTGGKW